MTACPPDFLKFLCEAFSRCFPGVPSPPAAEEIGAGGSTRRFCRLGRPPESLVGMLAADPPVDDRGVTENDSFIYVAQHLRAAGIAVPAIHAHEAGRGWFALEDAGDILLYDLHRRWGEVPTVCRLFHEAAAELARIHALASPGFDPRRTHNPDYDSDFIRRGESGYFQRCFLDRLEDGGLFPGGEAPAPPREGLDTDLDAMAEAAGRLWSPHFLYRDFQSQNIAVRLDRMIFLDFQGARRGPRQYDLASLLYDPYVELSAGLRRSVLSVYCRRVAELEAPFDEAAFRAGLPLIAAHRLMQALGAYGFLSRDRGKPQFVRHIPAALRLLGRLSREAPELSAYPAFVRCVAILSHYAIEGVPEDDSSHP